MMTMKTMTTARVNCEFATWLHPENTPRFVITLNKKDNNTSVPPISTIPPLQQCKRETKFATTNSTASQFLWVRWRFEELWLGLICCFAVANEGMGVVVLDCCSYRCCHCFHLHLRCPLTNHHPHHNQQTFPAVIAWKLEMGYCNVHHDHDHCHYRGQKK